jgi:hypothetical protein
MVADAPVPEQFEIIELGGKTKVESTSIFPQSESSRAIEDQQRAGAGAVPKLLFPRTTVVGEMRSSATLISIIQRELGAFN